MRSTTFSEMSLTSVMIFVMAAVMASWIAPPNTTAQMTTADSLRIAVKYGLHLEDQLIIARGDLRISRADSILNAKLYQVDLAGKDQQIQWLEDRLPRWYERPSVLVTTTAIVTIWAVLRAVQVSI